MLQEVGRRMQQVVRTSDTVARLGGDEFVLLLPSTGSSGAIEVASKVRAAVQEPISLNGQRVIVDNSIGVALCPTDAKDPPRCSARPTPRCTWRSAVARATPSRRPPGLLPERRHHPHVRVPLQDERRVSYTERGCHS